MFHSFIDRLPVGGVRRPTRTRSVLGPVAVLYSSLVSSFFFFLLKKFFFVYEIVKKKIIEKRVWSAEVYLIVNQTEQFIRIFFFLLYATITKGTFLLFVSDIYDMPKASKKESSFPFFFFPLSFDTPRSPLFLLLLFQCSSAYILSLRIFPRRPLPLRRRDKKDRVDKERPGATATAWMNENGAMRRRLEAGRGTIYSRRTR
jgi:hypothetical protein